MSAPGRSQALMPEPFKGEGAPGSGVDLHSLFGTDSAPVPAAAQPSRLRRVCIVGGGTAGWMTALILRHRIADPSVAIELVESPSVPTIGVGEGSTPALRGFFEDLGIAESEWMPACDATFKCGIRFSGWSAREGFDSYFHPFASILDNVTADLFQQACHERLRGGAAQAHPDAYFLATRLAMEGRAPKGDERFPFEVLYGYHFDAGLLGQYLAKQAMARGIGHRLLHVQQAALNGQGEISYLETREGVRVEADLFVDCTGFVGLLIEKALRVHFVSFGENLFNDAAVALPTPRGPHLPPATEAQALRHGWAWRIPLTSRWGNGYVYSSAFCSADQAEFELRERLGLLDADVQARHLKLRVGRRERHWHRNVLAIGLAQGFIEPLEATALLLIQRTAYRFADFFNAQDFGEAAQQRFNDEVNERFETTRDYIVAHYKTAGRRDTPYWRENGANVALSARLQQMLGHWLHAQPLPHAFKGSYPLMSWYALLAGMGLFPPSSGAAPLAAGLDDFLARSAQNFMPHEQALREFPQPRMGEALRVYRFH